MDRLNDIECKINLLEERDERMQKKLCALKKTIHGSEENDEGMQKDVCALKGKTRELKETLDFFGLMNQVYNLERNVGRLKEHDERMQNNLCAWKKDIDVLKKRIRGLEEHDERMQKNIYALKEKTRELKETLDSFGPMRQEYNILRLQNLGGRYENQPIDEGGDGGIYWINEVAQGGNVLHDCFLLRDMREEGGNRLEQCQQNFLELYDIESHIIDDAINNTSSSIVALYDFRPHTRRLKKWRNERGERKPIALDIEAKCTEAINCWESWVKAEPRTDPEPSMDEAVIEVQKLYARI